ncbi:PH domain-containing protein [Dysgonomonas capnocytophagoides]|uniref:PH domain-containing protein n=1 Tax=Dysgonomonas capnocytophagoides TaxID=45254 RepID=UPI00333F35A0
MTFEDIEKQGLYLGKLISMQKKSIKLMLDLLFPNETLLLLTNCNLKDHPGVLTLTDKRVIFTSKVLFTTIKKEILLDNITSIDIESAFSNKLTITSYNKDVFVISSIDKSVGERLIQEYNLQRNDETVTSTFLSLDDLEKLAGLKEKGIISEEEFQQKKRQILGL